MLFSALFCFVVIITLYLLLKIYPQKQRQIFIITSFIPIILVIIRIFYRAFHFKSIELVLQGLPFQMCGLAAIILPIIAIKKHNLFFSLVYFFSLPGTILTIILDTTVKIELLEVEMWCFLMPHCLYFVLPLLMIHFKYLKPKIKDIPIVFMMVLGFITFVHFLNLIINKIFGNIVVNYIFTILPGDTEVETGEFVEFPILKQAYALSNDTPYFYLFLLFPILLFVFFILALPFFDYSKIKLKRIKKGAK